MHCLGRRLVITLSLGLMLPLAGGCTQNSGGQFHAYQPSDKATKDATSGKEAAANDSVATSDIAPADSQATSPGSSGGKAGGQVPTATLASAPPRTDAKSDAPVAPLATVPKAPPQPPAAAGSKSVAGKGPQTDSTPRKVQVMIPNKTFRSEGEALRVSYDDIDLLKVLNMDPVPRDAATFMPAWLKGLDGRRIRIRGFMYPTFQQTGVHAFGLARDNQICCFGRNPKIYDVFDVVLHPGTSTDYIPNRPFDVVGVFHIRPEADAGGLYRLYEMDDAVVVAK
jgi:hypothetical protein